MANTEYPIPPSPHGCFFPSSGTTSFSKDLHFFFTSCAAPRYNQPIDPSINSSNPAFLSGEIMTFAKRFILWMGVFYFLLLNPSFLGFASAQGITPAQEQELVEAKAAIDAAQKAQAGKYAPETLMQAQDLCATAENARQSEDGVKFTQASRLARAYAELARAMAEVKTEEERVTAIQEELEKTRAEVDRLKKSQ